MLTTEGSKHPVETVKIKQEKLTPPPSPNANSSAATAAGFSITDDLLDNILGERKPVAEPVKSSNEILADLFKVFNAAPPTIDDGHSTKDSKKKKHKKEKKVKKHKKRSQDNSETKSSDDEVNKIKKHKTKKSKKREADDSDTDSKSQKRHKKSKDRDIKNEKIDVVVKKERNNDQKHASTVDGGESKTHNDTTSNKSRSTDEKNPQLNIQVSVTKDTDKRKIVIKSLVDSTVFQDTLKEVETKQKEKEREKLKEKEKQKDREKERAKEKDKERNKEKERRKQSSRRSKSHEKEHRRARSHSSSLSLSDEETYLRERERERERNKDRDRDRERDDFYGDYRRDTDRDRDFERRKHRSRNDFYRHDHDRRRSRSSSRHRRERSGDRIDKKRLLEIARKNAITMLKNGTLPGANNLDPEAKERALTKMRYGGKTVDELTEFCKKLSKGEANGYLSNISGDSDIDADLEKPFHHPFVIKDRGPIVMNIKNSTPIPPKTAEQTKAILQQFPVSSGQHHRLNESEWVPVVPAKPTKGKETEPTTNPTSKLTTETTNTTKSTTVITTQPAKNDDVPQPTADYGYQNNMFAQAPESAPSFAMPTNIESVPLPTEHTPGDNIFADRGTMKDLDVTSIVTSRLNALRKLQENPLDSEAIKLMYKTQKDMSAWASSKFVPGQFTGSTGASILSTKELASGFQAWAKRDQLISTTPVSGGMGMHLLQKMGWKPGEGLGKEKNGSLQPLLLEVKLDKKGLVAEEESPQVQRQRAQLNKKAKATSIQMAKQNFESKHPVSLLGELSAKRKFGAPLYELVMQEGPSHQRQFLYSVTIGGQIYQPNITSLNKKEAKASAAKYALQRMGFLSDVPMQPQPPAPQQPQQPQPPQPVQNNMNFAPPSAF